MTSSPDPASILESGKLDAELGMLPAPPADLPKPWDWSDWQRWLAFGFPATALGLWLLAKALNIELLQIFGLALATTCGLYLWLGLYLMGRFQMRGYSKSYAARANKELNRAIKRYKKKKPAEGMLQLFPRYEIDGQYHYLVWYVPGAPSALVANLSEGAEPLLFDHSGQWLDDEALFHKVMLMWSYALEISPRDYPFRKPLKKHVQYFRKVMVETMAKLPELLAANETKLRDRGLGPELERVRGAYEAKCALLRNVLHVLDRKLEWRKAYGWDSLTALRYEDVVEYHEAYEALIRSRFAFEKKHGLNEAEASAASIVLEIKPFREQFRGWKKRRQLITALATFRDQIPIESLNFAKEDAAWMAPPEFFEAYRSRIAHARHIDAEQNPAQEQAEIRTH